MDRAGGYDTSQPRKSHAPTVAAFTPGAPVGPTWTKTHQLEGDGLLPLLFHHLWKKNKNFQSCPGVKIPDTVVFEQNFPRAWYTYDFKNYEIVKRAGRFLDAHHIYMSFSKTEGCDICAQYFSMSEDSDGLPCNSVEYLRPVDLDEFLNRRKVRADGILQKFKRPTATSNAQIQVVWSPRLCLIQRRINVHRMAERTIPPHQRAVTYDGPPHLSEEGLCSEQTKALLLRMCNSIVEHFVSTEHKSISRFVLYFKVSQIPRQAAADGHNSLWLLWGSSLRVGDTVRRNQAGQQRSVSRPLSLSPNIMADTSHQGGTEEEYMLGSVTAPMEQILAVADVCQNMLCCGKWVEHRARGGGGVPAPPRTPPTNPGVRHGAASATPRGVPASSPRPLRDTAASPATPGGRRAADWKNRSSELQREQISLLHPATPVRTPLASEAGSVPRLAFPASPTTAAGDMHSPQASPRGALKTSQDASLRYRRLARFKHLARATRIMSGLSRKSPSENTEVDWHQQSPHVQERYESVHKAAKTLRTWMDDVFYNIYSHMLRCHGKPFLLTIPPYVKAIFTHDFDRDLLVRLLQGVVGMEPYDPTLSLSMSELAGYIQLPEVGDRGDAGDTWYMTCAEPPPFGNQGDEAHQIIDQALQVQLELLEETTRRSQGQGSPEGSQASMRRESKRSLRTRRV